MGSSRGGGSLDQVASGKGILLRIVAMLTKLLERFLGADALG